MKHYANFAPPRDKRRVPPDIRAVMRFPPQNQGQPGQSSGHLKSHRLTADYVRNDLNIGGSFPTDRISCTQTENMDTLVCEIE